MYRGNQTIPGIGMPKMTKPHVYSGHLHGKKQYALAEEYLLSLTKNAKVKSKHHRYFIFLGRVYIEEGKDA